MNSKQMFSAVLGAALVATTSFAAKATRVAVEDLTLVDENVALVPVADQAAANHGGHGGGHHGGGHHGGFHGGHHGGYHGGYHGGHHGYHGGHHGGYEGGYHHGGYHGGYHSSWSGWYSGYFSKKPISTKQPAKLPAPKVALKS